MKIIKAQKMIQIIKLVTQIIELILVICNKYKRMRLIKVKIYKMIPNMKILKEINQVSPILMLKELNK